MTAATDGKPTDAEIAKAYKAAMAYARKRAKGHDELREAAIDAATDAILWASKRYDRNRRGENGKAVTFDAFCNAVVRKYVWHRISNTARNIKMRPDCEQLSEALAAKGASVDALILDLPEPLKATMEFFYLHKFTMRECGVLLGCCAETIRTRLIEAGRIIAGGDAVKPDRGAGEKRIER